MAQIQEATHAAVQIEVDYQAFIRAMKEIEMEDGHDVKVHCRATLAPPSSRDQIAELLNNIFVNYKFEHLVFAYQRPFGGGGMDEDYMKQHKAEFDKKRAGFNAKKDKLSCVLIRPGSTDKDEFEIVPEGLLWSCSMSEIRVRPTRSLAQPGHRSSNPP